MKLESLLYKTRNFYCLKRTDRKSCFVNSRSLVLWPMDLPINQGTRKLLFLLLIYGVYLLSGAAIFQALETVIDSEQIKDINNVREYFIKTHNLTSLEFEVMVHKVVEVLKRRCQGTHNDSWCTDRWDYYSSLYFAVSVVTTIGKYTILFDSLFGVSNCF